MAKTTILLCALFLLVVSMNLISSSDSFLIDTINLEDNSTVISDSFGLSVTTNEDAVCKYSLGHSITFPAPPCEEGEPCGGGGGGGGASKSIEMAYTGGTEHSQLITGLHSTINNETQGEKYNIKVTCVSGLGNSDSVKTFFYVNIITIIFDTTPPIISNVQAVLLGKNTVNFNWDTNEPSYFNMVEYGKGKKYRYNISQQFNTNLTSIMIPVPSILLTLNKKGNYHYRVQSCDMFGNCAYSSDYKIKKRMFKAKKFNIQSLII